MIKKSLMEVCEIDPTHFQAVRYLALCSYGIGKLMPSCNGYTVEYSTYEELLKDLDYSLYEELQDDLEGVDSQFNT